jgi:lipopolysaccharide export system protein LptA
MKISLLSLAMLSLMLPVVLAQTETDDTGTSAAASAGTTIITSDALHMDQVAHTAIYTGNVVVDGTNFHLTCEEMTVYFTNGNKINVINAEGNVVINQPGRITHCGQAVYYRDEDKFVLTDQPDILDNNNEISAPKITIYRTTKKLETEGRSTTKIINRGGSSSETNTVANPAVDEPK